MHETLLAIKEAWDKESGDGRDAATAVALAGDYITQHPEKFEEMKDTPLEGEEGLVHAVDVLRAAGPAFAQQCAETEAWILYKWPPGTREIGGNVGSTIKREDKV